MSTIDLNLGDDVVVKGCLYDSMEPKYLREDILEIDLPSGNTLAVGWDSESGPNGRFAVVAFRETWDVRLSAAYATTIEDLVAVIHWMSRQWGHHTSQINEIDDSESSGVAFAFTSSPSRFHAAVA